MKIAIVEDNAVDSEILEELLSKFFLQENINFELFIYTSGEDLLVDWPSDFDIVFLDIHMEKMNGIEAAARIRETNERVVIIFVTHDPQYSLMGYSVDALDYLIKPITFDLLDRVLSKAVRRLGNLDRTCITIRNNEGYFIVNPMDIQYIELANRKLVIHTSTGSIACLKTMQNMADQLPDTFFRCHSAFLINLNAVESVRGPYAVVAGKMIPVSKHRKQEFFSSLTAFMGEKL